MHTNANSQEQAKINSALNFQGNRIPSASLSIRKAFQMIKMLPDNAFHFFLIGLLSNKLLIIDWGLQLACGSVCAFHLPRERRERETELGRPAWPPPSQAPAPSKVRWRWTPTAGTPLPMPGDLCLFLRKSLPALWG